MTTELESESFAIIIRWAKRFASLGAVCGVFMMFGKETLIAESGRKPDDVLWYSFWIPVMTIIGSTFGAGFGVLIALARKLGDW